ncbi:MAG: hypothetical protein AABX29_07175 [Nanoarchaeota archaeon]
MNWRENDLKVSEMRKKIIELTDEFNKKKGTNIKNYSHKLNRFLDKKLRKSSDFIFAEQMFMTISSLKMPNQNI